jgi:hypothetical protein
MGLLSSDTYPSTLLGCAAAAAGLGRAGDGGACGSCAPGVAPRGGAAPTRGLRPCFVEGLGRWQHHGKAANGATAAARPPKHPLPRRGSNSDVDVPRYRAVVGDRWRALGARSVHFVDVDADEAHEGHAIIVATASDVLVAFRGTSTPEGWAANAQLSPWQIATRGGQDKLNVHSGFLGSLIPVLPRIGDAVSKVRGRSGGGWHWP